MIFYEFRSFARSLLSFIAKDSRNRALDFKNQLDNKINDLLNFPYKFRQSKNHTDKNVRDMVFKGYTIAHMVEPKK